MRKGEWRKEKIEDFQESFLNWYSENARNLPWRENTQAYQVWISEIMLQQTRVDTVKAYYLRFMDKYPTIEDLANAKEDELLKIWEGLGYYSRARNLRVAANQVMSDFHGVFPEDIRSISTLKGIGPYTAGAIASIAFGLPEPAIDGNVMRVVSRLFEISDDIALPKTRKVFDSYVRQILPLRFAGEMNQAFMDLGSAICTPTNPKCKGCPLQTFCQSYENQSMLTFPVKTKKMKQKKLYYIAFAAQNEEGSLLLVKRRDKGLLANMWHFPMTEISEKEYQRLKEAPSAEFSHEGLTHFVFMKKEIGEITHIFTHLKWHVLVVRGFLKDVYMAEEPSFYNEEHAWVKNYKQEKLVFPKPQIKMFELLSC